MTTSSLAMLPPSVSPDNWWQQVEEIVALHAIYNEDFKFLGGVGIEAKDIDSLQNMEPPDLPTELNCLVTINVELPSDTLTVQKQAVTRRPDGSFHFPMITVKHLPPVALHLTFPPQYPSTRSPITDVQCCWLSYTQMGRVRRKLAELWKAHAPAPVCYVWIEWLRSSLFADLRVTSLCTERDLSVFEKYAADVEQRTFNEGVWSCKICLDQLPGTQCTQLLCGHIFCTACLQEQCKLHVKEGSVEQLKCPDPECGTALHPQTLRAVLTPAELARWEDLCLKRYLDAMSDMAYCPRCSTPCIEDDDHCAQCPKCFFVFCGLCFASWHPGKDCESLEMKLKTLQARATTLRDQDLIKRTMQEVESVKHIKETAKRCPKCGQAIEKIDGCNKMVCTTCSAKFCFECGKEIKGYDHYSGGKCILFDEEQIRQWEEQFNDEIIRVW